MVEITSITFRQGSIIADIESIAKIPDDLSDNDIAGAVSDGIKNISSAANTFGLSPTVEIVTAYICKEFIIRFRTNKQIRLNTNKIR